MNRLNPDKIKVGHSYRLMPYYTSIPGIKIIRRVEEIHDGNVVVMVNGKEVRMPIQDFAKLAVEEVADESTVYGICPSGKCEM